MSWKPQSKRSDPSGLLAVAGGILLFVGLWLGLVIAAALPDILRGLRP